MTLIERTKKIPWTGLFGIIMEGVALGLCFVPMATSLQLGLVFALLTLGLGLNILNYFKNKHKIEEIEVKYIIRFGLITSCSLLVASLILSLIISINVGGPIAIAIVIINIIGQLSYKDNFAYEKLGEEIQEEDLKERAELFSPTNYNLAAVIVPPCDATPTSAVSSLGPERQHEEKSLLTRARAKSY